VKQILGVFVRLIGVSKGRRREGGVSVGKGGYQRVLMMSRGRKGGRGR
jgi:hypothetical protein